MERSNNVGTTVFPESTGVICHFGYIVALSQCSEYSFMQIDGNGAPFSLMISFHCLATTFSFNFDMKLRLGTCRNIQNVSLIRGVTYAVLKQLIKLPNEDKTGLCSHV